MGGPSPSGLSPCDDGGFDRCSPSSLLEMSKEGKTRGASMWHSWIYRRMIKMHLCERWSRPPLRLHVTGGYRDVDSSTGRYMIKRSSSLWRRHEPVRMIIFARLLSRFLIMILGLSTEIMWFSRHRQHVVALEEWVRTHDATKGVIRPGYSIFGLFGFWLSKTYLIPELNKNSVIRFHLFGYNSGSGLTE